MKITKEAFWNLKQQDRIEYRQIYNIIDNYNFLGYFSQSIYMSAFLILFAFVLDIWVYLHNGKWMNYTFYNSLLKILKLFILVMFSIDILSLFADMYKKNKLNKRFFKVTNKTEREIK